jgi:hypothetical protein
VLVKELLPIANISKFNRMNKSLAREWAQERGVSARIRHLAYDWAETYSNLVLNSDNSRILIREAKRTLKDLMEKETDRGMRRTLKYELRFLRFFWNRLDDCDCCDCSGCYLNSPDKFQ